ncbi:dihydroorotase family protein [Nanoarchaeota archaeon]
MTNILIQNCRIPKNGKLTETDILIKNGKIAKIAKSIKTSKQNKAKKIDAKNNIVLPGIIDSHVHFRDPGLTHKGNWLTESRAAAAGGITSVIDMPNTIPPTFTVKELNKKRKAAKKSIVNYGLYIGTNGKNSAEIKKAKNIAGLKVYMNETTGNLKLDNGLKEVFNTLNKNKLVAVHAEGNSVKKAIKLSKKNRLYLCHISKASELIIIKKAKKQKKHKNKIFVEVTPHHLFLTKSQQNKFNIMKPELRTKTDQNALWKAINSGLVDTIATDHAPHTKAEKKKPGKTYGVPGVQTSLQLMLDAVNKKKLSLAKLQELMCENPAKIFNIKNKGKIKKGYDADLVIVDINKKNTITNSKILYKCKWTPYNGKKVKGAVITTLIKGNMVYNDNKIKKIKARQLKFG